MRLKVPSSIETEILLSSGRRCCLCFGLNFDLEQKAGQIAHLDQNRENNDAENLAWLCLFHHDSYDTKTSQSKGITLSEVKAHRQQLYQTVKLRRSSESEEARNSIRVEKVNERAFDVVYRYRFLELEQMDVVVGEILNRLCRINAFNSAMQREYNNLDTLNMDEFTADQHIDSTITHTLKQLDIPDGVYGLHSEGNFPETWINQVSTLIEVWVNGMLTYSECTDVLWQLDDRFDTDMHYILYGIPNADLSAAEYSLLRSFIYEFGMRNNGD